MLRGREQIILPFIFCLSLVDTERSPVDDLNKTMPQLVHRFLFIQLGFTVLSPLHSQAMVFLSRDIKVPKVL